MGNSVFRLVSFSFFAWLSLACAGSQQTARDLSEPAKASDFLVPDKQVGGLSRSDEKNVQGKSVDALSAEDAERWQRCGVVEASQARYHGGDSKADVTLRVLVFAKPWDAFCAFTPGRSDVAHPVLDVEGSFEDKNFARAWRGPYLVEVIGDLTEENRDKALGLLRTSVARMPVNLPAHILEQGWFAESSVDAETEEIVFGETLPGLSAAALVVTAKCEKGEGRAFAIPFSAQPDAQKALDAYQQRELENFSEVEPYSLQGLKGAKVVGEQGTNIVLLSGRHLVGMTALKADANCDEFLSELAIRSAPSAGGESAADDAAASSVEDEGSK